MVGAEEVARLAADLVGTRRRRSLARAPAGTTSRGGSSAPTGVPWIVRAAASRATRTTLAAEVRREVAVMQLARRRPRRPRRPTPSCSTTSRGCLAHPRLPGTPLQDLLAAGRVPATELDRLAREIGVIIGDDRARSCRRPACVADDGLPVWFAGLPRARDRRSSTCSRRPSAPRSTRFLATPAAARAVAGRPAARAQRPRRRARPRRPRRRWPSPGSSTGPTRRAPTSPPSSAGCCATSAASTSTPSSTAWRRRPPIGPP